MHRAAPLWSSGFRPFYLCAAAYAPLLIAGVGGALAGLVDLAQAGSAAHLWHGHEMLFGFAVAVIIGTLLTALPSWAGMPEIRGRALALLVGLWLLGRLAFWASPWLPRPLLALADALLLPCLIVLMAPSLWRLPERRYRLLPPFLLALALANGLYLVGLLRHDEGLALHGLRFGVYAVMVLYVAVGGLLTPIFTGNALRQSGRGVQAPFLPALEWLAIGLVVLLAALDLLGANRAWVGAMALCCALVHALRVVRWKGWRAREDGLLWPMHLGFAWLIVAFALRALASLSGAVPPAAWLHAFTIGALGLMMLGLMTRVSLRHTGRPLVTPYWLGWACAAMSAATLLRLAASLVDAGGWLIGLAALLWAMPFVAYLLVFAGALLGPSLPRAALPPPR